MQWVKECTQLVPGGLSNLCFFRENFLQDKTQPRLFDGKSEMQAGDSQATWTVLNVGYFSPLSLSLFLSMSRGNYFCGSKVNIPDRRSASYHEEAAKLL